MYNLSRDPQELRNLAGREAYRARKRQLSRLLKAYQNCAGAA